jgi:hypothetical protein
MQTLAEASATSGEPLANEVPANLQARVHAMIQNIGGYWRPVNAVARLLEELAELGLANQFNVVPRGTAKRASGAPRPGMGT